MFKPFRHLLTPISLMLVLFSTHGLAGEICKTTDSKGRTVYTECSKVNPDRESEEITINTQQNTIPLQQTTRELQSAVPAKPAPPAKKTPSPRKQAQIELEQAKKNYEEAQKLQPGDYVGGRISIQRYNRLNEAQKALDEAQAKVNK